MNERSSKFAVWMTILWLAGIFSFYVFGLFERPTSFNELGDFLAGIFAPIAFLWLILGYRQQSKQLEQNSVAINQQAKALKQQAEALNLQIIELRESVTQQKEMIKIQMNVVKPRVRLLSNGTAQIHSDHYEKPVYKFNVAFENVGGGDAFNIELTQNRIKNPVKRFDKLHSDIDKNLIEAEFYLVLFNLSDKRHKQFNIVLTYEDIHQKKYQQDFYLILLGNYNKPDEVFEIKIKEAHICEL